MHQNLTGYTLQLIGVLDLRVVVFLDVLHGPHVVVRHEIDGHTLTAKTTASSDSVQVVLHILGKVKIDNQSGDRLGEPLQD